jgi:Ca-activated chloride channel homolog
MNQQNIFCKMIKTILLLLIIATSMVHPLKAQQENADIRRGNREFRSENFQDAELNYRKALELSQGNPKAMYNLAAALYKQGRYDEAANILEGLAQSQLPDDKKADVYHNLGNASVGSQKIKEGVEAFKNSLRLRPDDMDTRHNLAYAMRLLQEQEQQQQNQDQDQDQDQDNEGEDENEQQQDQDQQSEPQQNEERPRPDQISPQDAERILDALNQKEQDVQQKIDREQKQRQPLRPEREW